tara:strand:+ start:482 stop:1180 length:699 start_codon:yes stop_codon:yes gene_type:complete
MKFGSITTPIISDGLVFNLDAANRACYPKTGPTTDNTINAVNSGSFQDDTIFSTDHGGAFNFDGVDDYIDIGTPIPQATTAITVNVWFKGTGAPSNNDTAGGVLFAGNPGLNHGPFLSYSWANQQIYWSIYINQPFTFATSISQNTLYNVCATFNKPTGKIYINSIKQVESDKNYNVTYQNTTSGNRIGEWGYSSYQRNFNGQIYSVQVYNRELSSTEVLHNYNALKSRFGL